MNLNILYDNIKILFVLKQMMIDKIKNLIFRLYANFFSRINE